VGITQLPPPARPSPGRFDAFIAGGAYALLFLLGLVEGVLGSFQYSRGVFGAVPVGAIAFDVAIFVTCALSAWAMRSMAGALLPSIGWFVASFGLAMPNSGGSVIIANISAGEWYLYGGSIFALAGVASAFITATRRPLRDRGASLGTGAGSGSGSGSGRGGQASPRAQLNGDRNRTAGGGVPPA
jgi:hypothetical protein